MKLFEFAKRFAMPLWGWYAAGFLVLALTNVITLVIPQLAKKVVNAIAAEQALGPLTETTLLIIGLGLLMIVIRATSRILIFWPGRKLEATLKSQLFAKALKLPHNFFLEYGMGDLISRLANDVNHLRVFFAFGLLQILNVGFLLVFTIFMMVSIHPQLTLFCLLPMLIMIVVVRYAMPRMHQFSRDNQEALGRLTNRTTEAFVNIHVVQANAAEDSFAKRAARENLDVFRTNVKLVVIRTVIFPLMVMLSGLSELIVLFYGGSEAINNRLTVGDILAFNVYIGFLRFPLTAMGIIIAVYQRAKTALDRINDIQNAEIEAGTGVFAGKKLRSDKPLLEVRNLEFRFPYDRSKKGSTAFALSRINFKVEDGQRLGLFGAVGSGKTTLFNLITRVWDPPPKTIFFRGKDILDVSPQDLRRQIGYAQQSVHLFSDTVRGNLTLGFLPVDPDKGTAINAQLIEAANKAEILTDVERFDDTWQTEIGERGIRLSGGQKQRLALARIFLRRQPLLLLDDVMSAVDHSTEKKIIRHIYNTECGLIISSHRGSSLRDCDEILLLHDGTIVRQGSFSEIAAIHPQLLEDVRYQSGPG